MRLARLRESIPIIGRDGGPLRLFVQWWQSLVERVEAVEDVIPGGTGIGEWTLPTFDIPGGTITLPAGGTWAWFVSNNGAGDAGVDAGGTVVLTAGGALSNAFGFCWRVE